MNYWKRSLPIRPFVTHWSVCRSVGRLVGCSVRHHFLKGRKVNLQNSYRSTCSLCLPLSFSYLSTISIYLSTNFASISMTAINYLNLFPPFHSFSFPQSFIWSSSGLTVDLEATAPPRHDERGNAVKIIKKSWTQPLENWPQCIVLRHNGKTNKHSLMIYKFRNEYEVRMKTLGYGFDFWVHHLVKMRYLEIELACLWWSIILCL